MQNNPFKLALGVTLSVIVAGGAAVFIRGNQDVSHAAVSHAVESSSKKLVLQDSNSDAAPEIAWASYDKGLAQAASAEKLVMVEFFATWCGYCKKMDTTVFPDPDVKKQMAKYFIPVRVTESSDNMVNFQGKMITEKQLTQEFGVTGFPTLVFLDQKGEPITKIPGFVAADTLQGAMQFIGTGSYKTMDYATFQKDHMKAS